MGFNPQNYSKIRPWRMQAETWRRVWGAEKISE